jgi:hypothetical protein
VISRNQVTKFQPILSLHTPDWVLGSSSQCGSIFLSNLYKLAELSR